MNKKFEFLRKIREVYLRIWNVPILFSFVLAFFLVGVVEALSRHSFFGGLEFFFDEPLYYVMNTVVIAAPISFTYFFKKRVFAQFIVSFVVFAIACINFVLLFTRIKPFEAVDFSIFRTGISIVKVYLNTFEIVLCIVAILTALFGIGWVFVKSPKADVNVKEASIASLASLLVAVAVIYMFSITELLPESFEDSNKAYAKYGFTYCFTRSIFDRGIDQPENYDEYSVEEILANIGSDKTNAPDGRPNIIMVQLESFMDPSEFKNVEFEYNPVPNFTALKENCTSGKLKVPSVGSGTANTEFEVLTGMCLDYFGTGEYPYKTILQSKNCETICYNLSELGYTSQAFHNHTGTFYNRNIVYRNIGFDSFTPLEYMHSYEVNQLGWAKDYVLVDEIMTALDLTKKQDFVFAVSVQGHGKYPERPIEGEKLIPLTAKGEEPFYKHQLEYYAYQLWEMDDFIGKLVRELSEYDEDCVLVLYGDHQPSIEYSEDDIISGDKHITEYVIWSNFKLEEKDRDLEAFQLSSYVLQQLDINNGLLTKLHQTYSDESDYDTALRTLEYDMLYGKMLSYGEGHEYISPDMKLGIKDIKITGISYINECFYVIGENFTHSSRIYVNGRGKGTVYVSPTVLILEGYIPKKGDRVTVKQITNDFVELSECEEYLFSKIMSEIKINTDVKED